MEGEGNEAEKGTVAGKAKPVSIYATFSWDFYVIV